jgi:hypothetical protein
LLADALGDMKAEADSLSVELLGGVEKSEKFEQFFLVFLFYSDS